MPVPLTRLSSTPTAADVVMKAKQSEESWWPNWRGMRSSARQFVGLPPLRNSRQRLVDHYDWINRIDSREDVANAGSPAGSRRQRGGAEANGRELALRDDGLAGLL